MRDLLRRAWQRVRQHPIRASSALWVLALWLLHRIGNFAENVLDERLEETELWKGFAQTWNATRISPPRAGMTSIQYFGDHWLEIGIIIPLGYIALILLKAERDIQRDRRSAPKPHAGVATGSVVLPSASLLDTIETLLGQGYSACEYGVRAWTDGTADIAVAPAKMMQARDEFSENLHACTSHFATAVSALLVAASVLLDRLYLTLEQLSGLTYPGDSEHRAKVEDRLFKLAEELHETKEKITDHFRTLRLAIAAQQGGSATATAPIRILKPAPGELVGKEIEVEGTVSNRTAEVWVAIHEMNTNSYHFSTFNPLTVRDDGSWTTVATLGHAAAFGRRFEIRAIINLKPRELEWPGITWPGIMKDWPEAEACSEIVEVKRKANPYDPHS